MCLWNQGIVSATYDAEFRNKHQLYLSILKEFGFGQRLMECRINVEITEFINQARLTDGKSFDPKLLIHTSVINVTGSILFGRRYPTGHPTLVDLKNRLEAFSKSMVTELELFPFLRFVPPYRGRLLTFIEVQKSLTELIQSQVTRNAFVHHTKCYVLKIKRHCCWDLSFSNPNWFGWPASLFSQLTPNGMLRSPAHLTIWVSHIETD